MPTQEAKVEYEIKPPKGLVSFNFPELWRYRELLYVFAWRDIKVRYKQTVLGVLWAIFQPLLTMIIFTIFFGNLAKIPSDGIPYPVFVYSGLLLWNYFSSALANASDCLVVNESIVKKTYFPRLLLPVSTAITPIIDFIFSLLVLLALMAFYHFTPSILGIMLLPILLLIALLNASGLGLFLSAINAKYRDIRYVLPFFIQILMYVTPVIYPVSLIPDRYRWLMYLNPMSGVITIARATLLDNPIENWHGLGLSVVIGVIPLVFGIAYFRKTERFFADVL